MLQTALPAACAVEMIHTYSLVHDDLPAMDDDDLRRGRPTCHKVYGEANAILVGDALQALAFEVLARGVQPAETAVACVAALAHAAGATALVGGQADDLAGADGRAKSGGGRPGGIGNRSTSARPGRCFTSRCGWADWSPAPIAQRQAALETYGRRLGLAFQIADDLLDVRGEESAVGKRLGKDSTKGKLTFPGLLGIDESRQYAQRLIDEASPALAPLAPAEGRLAALARFVLERNRELMDDLLSTIQSPLDLQRLTLPQLKQLAAEMREALCKVVADRTAHFASNLGVVELCLACTRRSTSAATG